MVSIRSSMHWTAEFQRYGGEWPLFIPSGASVRRALVWHRTICASGQTMNKYLMPVVTPPFVANCRGRSPGTTKQKCTACLKRTFTFTICLFGFRSRILNQKTRHCEEDVQLYDLLLAFRIRNLSKKPNVVKRTFNFTICFFGFRLRILIKKHEIVKLGRVFKKY